MIWNEKMECADRDTMRSVQLEKLKKTVKHAYDNVSHYRNKMDEAGVKPEDIKSLDDITKLPFITKEDIADGTLCKADERHRADPRIFRHDRQT